MISSSMNVHQIQTITIERESSEGTKWIKIYLKDAEGHSLDIAVFRGNGTWPEVKNETVA